MKKIIVFATITLCVVFSACTNTPENVTKSNQLPPIFPDYIDVTIPVGIAPLNFNVMGEVDRVDVIVRGSKEGKLHVNDKWAAFDVEDWHRLLAANQGGKLTVTVCAKVNGKWIGYHDFDMHVSSYDLDEWGVTYRRIAPGYEIYSQMGLYQRDLGSFDESIIIDNVEVYGMCVNCHTSNRTNPDQFVFHVRGEHGATMVQQSGRREWLNAKNETLGGSMVYPYWHPSGLYCAFSTNQTRQGFHISDQNRIEVFDLTSDVFVYHPATHEIISDSLLQTSDWSENTPTFSPDGKTLYYMTCKQQDYPLHYKDEKYNLCKIAFNPEEGTFGDHVDTLFNAVAMGKSLTWPRPSYDGKYILFTLIDYGYFSIWHEESEQWLLNLHTGEAHPLDEINSLRADSFHNWNVNSHWIVFTSRRDDGLYSRLYLTSIDDKGHFTKPFMLPQKNPKEYYGKSLYSFNTPDFTKRKVDFDTRKAISEVLSDNRINTKTRE